LMALAARNGWRVYFLGGAPGAAAEARTRLQHALPALQIVGVDAPHVDADGGLANEADVLERIAAAAPDLILVGLGSPKQERWIARYRASLGDAVAVAVGVSLEFMAGYVRRAPRWMSQAGLEWLFRLSQEPGRLWRRYLLRDPYFVWIVLRQMSGGGRIDLSPRGADSALL
jgi:N-acetylglucosaminyldiphosphoundecaprenol N-acetyl-beta-D-mannosaminyltransferase